MEITRRHTLAASAWSAPLLLASATIPAYAASQVISGIQTGLFVTTQYNGGYVGYAGSNDSTGHATSPQQYFASAPNTPEADINWNDATSRPTNSNLYANGEGSFTPVTTSANGANGAYSTQSGFWFSVPTNNVATGTDYIAGSTATLAAGATFITQVEFTIPAGANAAWPGANVKIDGTVWKKQLTGNLVGLAATAPYLQTANVAGTWTAVAPTNTLNTDGSYTFRSTITYKTTQALTLTQKGTKYYGQVIIMPAQVALNPAYGWDYFSLTSSVQSANITYTANGTTATQNVTGLTTTSKLNP